VSARYLVRFDDICPTMNWSAWSRIEDILGGLGIAPLLAVVPDNQDSKLKVHAPRADFWQWVRERQAAGWCIALHGYQHYYETRSAGIMGINAYSEFAGLPEAAQRDKLTRALAIFANNGVRADVWVAPAHSFDAVTVNLLLELGVGTISDGFYFRPVSYMGAYWIPQQLWHFRPMPGGLWTVCLHCNRYGESEIAQLRRWLSDYAHAITSVGEVRRIYPPRAGTWVDRTFAALLPHVQAARRRVRIAATQPSAPAI
jgi:peptidoglycan/xylan/chitin deacetylase (PgdA/CDA1 family)